MSSNRANTFLLLPMTIAAVFATQQALADVSFSRNIEVFSSGPLNDYRSMTEVKTQVSGDKSRSETKVTTAGDDKTRHGINIVRLDKAVSWQLDVSEKEYQERSLDDLQGELSALRDTLRQQTNGEALPINPDNCSWSEAKVSSKKTKEKERIAGIRATRHLLKVSQTCLDEVSQNSCEFEWSMEPWMATRVKNKEEVGEFYQQLADELSMDYLIPQMSGPSQLLLGLFPNRWEMLLDEMEEFPGYPVRNVMTLRIGGRSCLTVEGEAVVEGGMFSDAGSSAYNAAIDQSGREAGSAAGTATREAIGDSVGGSIGGAAIGAATGELLGGVTGMFKKKKKKKTTTRVKAPSKVTVFKVSSEIVDWDDKQIAGEQFDIPQDWSVTR